MHWKIPRCTEVFDASFYCGLTPIEIRLVSVSPNSQTLVSFIWDTTGFGKGNYTISACGRPLSWVLVSWVGDVDGDTNVDIFDTVIMAGVYGGKQPNPRYNPYCEIDGDGDIDIFDLVAAAMNYGEDW